MNIRLNRQDQRLVSDCLASGAYRSAGELIREGLLLVKHRDELRNLKLEALRRDLQTGERQFARGQYSEYSTNEISKLAKWVRKEGRRRLAQRTSQSSRALERRLAAGYRATAARDRKLTRRWDHN